ncbi:MAG: alanine transaminase [Chitinivibrionales bacterium]|nr:alanine transaminase [Chitinivibrionales bacterium]
MDSNFLRIQRLPEYVFSSVDALKKDARSRGEDIIDFGMGNPDQPTPEHIVRKVIEVVLRKNTHRYSQSKGIPRLRAAITHWYRTRYKVEVHPDDEAIVTIGSKEGIAHLALALVDKGDSVLVPDPSYPIHSYSFVIAGAELIRIPLLDGESFLEFIEYAVRQTWPRPKALLLNFPANPTTQCVAGSFFEKIVALAKKHRLWVIHDLAYADIAFDGYKPPSILQIPGAKQCSVEFFSLSKSYNMAGWRIGFCCGNRAVIQALARIKSYLDYGIFTPVQVAAIQALEGPQECVGEITRMYQQRRDVLCEGLNRIGWQVNSPKATMFVWARIPSPFEHMKSLVFSKWLLTHAQVAVSPGIGFGAQGDGHVRFALVENEHRIRQAVRSMRLLFEKHSRKEAGHEVVKH